MHLSKIVLLVPYIVAALAAPALPGQDAAKMYIRGEEAALKFLKHAAAAQDNLEGQVPSIMYEGRAMQDAAKFYDRSLAGQDAAKFYDRRNDQDAAKFYDRRNDQDAAKFYDRRSDQDAAKFYDRRSDQDAAKFYD